MPAFALPDFEAASFDPTSGKAILAQQGALLLRGMFPSDLITDWAPSFAAAFERADHLLAKGELSQHARSLYQYGHVSPAEIPHYPELEQSLVQTPGFAAFLRAYYGEEVCIIKKNTVPRRQSPQIPEMAIAWHQDQEFVGQMPSGLNVWIPLTPAGGYFPGLEIWLESPQKPLLSLQTPPEQRQQILQKLLPARLWRPELQPGDILLLTFFTLHRTHLSSEMQQTRISHEIRMAERADTWVNQSPLTPYLLPGPA